MRDRVQEMHAARARAAALKSEQTKQRQAEARARHEAKRDTFRAELRNAYAGTTDDFERFIWPARQREWELGQVDAGGVQGSVKQLLATGRYKGF